jgi:hypothetical protein
MGPTKKYKKNVESLSLTSDSDFDHNQLKAFVGSPQKYLRACSSSSNQAKENFSGSGPEELGAPSISLPLDDLEFCSCCARSRSSFMAASCFLAPAKSRNRLFVSALIPSEAPLIYAMTVPLDAKVTASTGDPSPETIEFSIYGMTP